jgi:glycosyltransferase involved in cell wall biosynthesis
MVSVITSIHNQLGMNQLFYETLKKHTRGNIELIVIDNNSTDGSREYFQDKADKLILNNGNYSYPYCQNQGIDAAQHEYLAFLNNDLLVSEGWDEKIVEIMNRRGIDVISFATNDHLESKAVQRKLHRRWKRIKNTLRFLFGTGYQNLRLMSRLMYGDFDEFCKERFLRFGDAVIEGFSGSCILMTRAAIDRIGRWDEHQQAADFDLFYRIKVRSIEQQDMKPIQLALGVYFHHFQRLTLRSARVPPFVDEANLVPLDQKWGDRADVLYRDVIG